MTLMITRMITRENLTYQAIRALCREHHYGSNNYDIPADAKYKLDLVIRFKYLMYFPGIEGFEEPENYVYPNMI